MNDNDDVKRIKTEIDLLSYIQRTKGGKAEHLRGNDYRINPCPICGHKDHFTVYRGTNSFSSFSGCFTNEKGNSGGTIIDFYMKVHGKSKAETIVELKKEIGIDTYTVEKETYKMNDNKENIREKWNDDLINEWHKRVGETDYFKNRGLTDKTINKYRLGFNPEGSKQYLEHYKLSMPVTDEYVIVRITRPIEGKPKTMNAKGVDVTILNLDYIKGNGKYIFITEGYFDALSLEELDYKCMALNSAAMVGKLKEALENDIGKAREKVFIFIPDNDKAGQAAKEKMQNNFKGLNIPLEVLEIPEQYKDANEYLVGDREGLKNDLEGKIKSISDQNYTISRIDEYLKRIEENKYKSIISTGFLPLNSKMGGGIFPGLYVIGGISSVGKTAFTLQLADNIAEKGTDVIFFSLEMSEIELFSRTISRQLFLTNKDKCKMFGTHEVMRGNGDIDSKLMNEALQRYEKIASHLNVIEGNFDTGVSEIRASIQSHINKTGKKPVVFIDYLQVLKSNGNGTDKMEMDYNVTELKRISRDFDIPIIVVSSFNRMNYSTQVSMESFKESGSIEYTSDVLIGLQLSILDETKTNQSGKETPWTKDEINAAKKEIPRRVTAVILKQRNAESYARQQFLFYAKNNLFVVVGGY